MASLCLVLFLLPTVWQLLLGLILVLAITSPLRPASATHPYDWSPSISLTDDSGEPDGNGMCLDIAGFGTGLNCDRLQAHSCKPQGSDTQFGYDETTQSIYSINFSADCQSIGAASGNERGGCVAMVEDGVAVGAALRLSDCDGSLSQRFVYTFNGQFRMETPRGNLCLAVGDEVRPAGRYWASDLILGDCQTSLARTQWTLDNEWVGYPAEDIDDFLLTTGNTTNSTLVVARNATDL